MIHEYSILRMADNAGARSAKCIRVLGGTKRRYAGVGDLIVVAVHDVLPNGPLKEGEVSRAVVVRTKKEFRRTDGSYIRFDENAAVLLHASSDLWHESSEIDSSCASSPSHRKSFRRSWHEDQTR